jgi:hypothetical protein
MIDLRSEGLQWTARFCKIMLQTWQHVLPILNPPTFVGAVQQTDSMIKFSQINQY